ncbi:SH3 domain-containing protein [Salinisphaera sp.]|uniref:SH3 domain-containing protein n=1 Tax=Salinisphaera sp. TaxID=1914330 RepID=UPI0025E80184|nr:SH3 domain-containing protein [Salinisphaera sp.]
MKHKSISRLAVIAISALACATSAVAQQGPSDAEAAQVLKSARPLAENGNATAQYNMGVLYDEGYGVDQDYAQARDWYEKAAAQNYSKAEHNLGIMYQEGHGVPQSDAKAAEWFKRAAENGEPAAQNNLAVLYVRGNGVPQDLAEAARWAAKAAEAGNESARNNLPQIVDSLPQSRIDGNNVNIRSQPNTRGRVIRQADRNTRVAVLDSDGDWRQVVFVDDYAIGWVADFLLAGNTEPLAGDSEMASADMGQDSEAPPQNEEAQADLPQGVSETGPIRYIGGDVVNVRSGPSTGNRVKFQAKRNERVMVTGREEDWRRIRFDDGRTGWIAGFLLVE